MSTPPFHQPTPNQPTSAALCAAVVQTEVLEPIRDGNSLPAIEQLVTLQSYFEPSKSDIRAPSKNLSAKGHLEDQQPPHYILGPLCISEIN